jgi:crotonobetainyl-CoA:carnitine CoA-transferase CaiB-like acyl-CoA transferase
VIVPPPLAGVRVLDLTRLLPGPMCTLYLADLGADVVKIEDTRDGDYARSLPTSIGAPRSTPTTWYRALNRDKRSLAIDLRSDAGANALLALARRADVVIEGFRPGVVHALGIDDARLRAVNPRLVYCSLSGYGQTGPRAKTAGHDINYLGYAGVLDATGERNGRPALANLQVADLLGGAASAAIAILGALFGAARTGHGRYVDVAMADAVLAHEVVALGALADTGRVGARGDDLLTGGVPCYGVYETGDARFVAVGALEAKFWRTLCEALGRIDLVDGQFATGEEGERVRQALGAVLRTRSRDDWARAFENVDCCVSPVLSFAEALADPQFGARAMLRNAGGTRAFAAPFALTPPVDRAIRSAPRHGEHSREVLREAGIDDAAIDALVASGVVKEDAKK